VNTNTDRWLELDDLFHRASEIDPSERGEFLEKACDGDTKLQEEVEALLAAADKTLGWLKRPVDNAAREVAFVGRRIGSYVLLRLVAEGGMGKVFLAARADDQYQQLVAIKLMRAELWRSDLLMERFRAERQILANLNHRYIARLLDGGMTSDDVPYLVMEFVEGVPLDEYCRANNLTVADKLNLFLRICSAVEYAHKNLVVHRDIKPGNVLVSGDGTPKLVDFGIAKLLEDDARSTSQTTARMMTPEYASPEQLRAGSITTATDVYGLGVLLYHLLAGTYPFAEHTDDPVEMMRHICEMDPQPPSSIVGNWTDREHIKGDLDRVVLMAMRKQPEERYPSATALARDVFAYLNGYPVLARAGGWSYRTGKFVSRHKLVVAALAIFAIALTAFGIGMGVLKQRANRERLKAEREATFLADMFLAGTPEEARGRTITARELLDRGALRVDKELAGEPSVRASLLYSIADAYSRLGFYDRAKELARRSYDIRKQLLGPRDPATADSLLLLASAVRLNAEYGRAEPLLREVLDIQRTGLGDHNTAVADTLSLLGECLYLEGNLREAEPKLRQALAMFRRRGPNLGSSTRDYLARLLEVKGDYVEAAELLKEAVEIERRNKGLDSPTYTASLHNLAGALARLGDLYSAEAELRESVQTERRVLGSNHPNLGYPVNMLGVVALDEGDCLKAEPLLRESFSIWSSLGPTHPFAVTRLTNWGRVLGAKGKYAEARSYFERALRTAEGQADRNYYMGWVLSRFAVLEFDAGDYRAAETLAQRALASEHAIVGGDTAPNTAMTMVTLAEARLFEGNPLEAETILRRSVAMLRSKLPGNYPPVAMTEVRLGEALTAAGKAAEGEPILRRAFASTSAPPFQIPVWQAGEAESALGWCLAVRGRTEEAYKLLQSSQPKLMNDPRRIFRKQAAAHFTALADPSERP
jgi:serine/threonine-protein kinase